MSDEILISAGTEKVFEHIKSELIIGLTGRTGSGCTTLANILNTQTFEEILLPDLPNPPTSHEDRKNRIVCDWLTEHWVTFKKIHVSQLLVLSALEESVQNFFRFIKDQLDTENPLAHEMEYFEGVASLAVKYKKILEDENSNNDNKKEAFIFYYVDFPKISESIKEKISSHQQGAYTKLFQTIGDNLRRSGNPFDSTNKGDSLFIIPRKIELLINLGRDVNKINGILHNYFVIDALRHPFEIIYLRDRLPHFFSIAITTEDKLRINRLEKLNYRHKEIQSLDAKEYPEAKSELKGYDKFVSQNIQACLEKADIFISNSSTAEEEASKRALAQEICRYVALMQHPGLVTPTSIERCMQAAFASRLNSGCISRQVGAVVTDNNYSIKSVGWNDVPRGQVPCILRYSRDLLKSAGDYKAFSNYEQKDKDFHKTLRKHKIIELEQIGGRHITYCFKSVYNDLEGERNQVHTRSLHAEENAFLQIVKYGGQGITGGFLFTTASPCELCAKKAAQLGISKVYYIDPYPGISSSHIFGYEKNTPVLELFSGVIGQAYHQLYTPLMPYKDELKAIVSDKDLTQKSLF